MTRPIPIAALLSTLLVGCLLEEEDCGFGFVFEDGFCVPAEAPPPFRGDGAPPPADGGPMVELLPEPEPEPEPPPEPDEWAGYGVVLIVDRTPLGSAAGTPASPGADIDAVQAIERVDGGDVRIGLGGEVLDALLEDPFEGSLNLDPGEALGPPDGRYASLGPDGGFIYIGLALERPLRRGDVLVVVERLEPGGGDDSYLMALCRDADNLAECRQLGQGQPGTTRFVLE